MAEEQLTATLEAYKLPGVIGQLAGEHEIPFIGSTVLQMMGRDRFTALPDGRYIYNDGSPKYYAFLQALEQRLGVMK